MDARTDTIDLLNALIETCKDGEYGFERCADRIDSPALRPLLARHAQQCAAAAAELQALVSRYGGKPEDSGTTVGTLHRGWVSLKDSLTGSSDHAVLTECERGEDVALRKYAEVLETPHLPAEARALVERQYRGVQANHAEIRRLRDAATLPSDVAG